MIAGCSLLAAGSWDGTGHTVISNNGLVSARRTGAGVVVLSLHYPVNENSITCIVTQRGGAGIVKFAVEQTDNVKKTVRSNDGRALTDASFDFFFVKTAEPQQGGLGGA